MPIVTQVMDVDGLLCSWLPTSFLLATVSGDVDEVTGVRWTDGRPFLLRERVEPTSLKMPFGTVSFLHSYGFERPWHNRATAERLVTITNEALTGVAGQDTYQVRHRDIANILSVTVDNVAVAGTVIVTTPAWTTPDAVRLSPAALALVTTGSIIRVTYQRRVFDVGSEVEGWEVYRLEGKTKDILIEDEENGDREYPASRVGSMWLRQTIDWLQANMQRPVAGQPTLKLESAGDSESGAGLLPVEDETEARFVVDVCLYRRTQVFTEFDLRRIGHLTYTLEAE